MGQQRAEYEATGTILYNDVIAYKEGDPVDARVVDGPGAWVPAEKVRPSGVIKLETPAKSASHARWVDYAVQQGADPEQAADASRADLIAEYGPKDDG